MALLSTKFKLKPQLTGAEIKSLYEVEPNAFTDADKTKLIGIEAEAQVTWIITSVKTSNYIAANNERIPCDTSVGPFTITLPNSGRVSVFDIIGTTPDTGFGVNSLTISPDSGQTVMGDNTLEVDIGASSVELYLVGTDWRIVDGITSADNASLDVVPGSLLTDGSVSSNKLDASVNVSLGLADTALQPTDIGVTVQGYSANTVIDANYVATENSYTTTEKNKLAGIEAEATADQTAAEILTAIKTVDGANSGLDADTVDGLESTAFATAAQGSKADALYYQPTDVKTSAYTAVSGDAVLCDTTGGAFTVTLPASGTVKIVDYAGTSAATGFGVTGQQLTITPSGGSTIMGETSIDLDVGQTSYIFTLYGTDWKLFDIVTPWVEVTDWSDIVNKPTLGTAASTNSTDYATAAQGELAGTALQPGDIGDTVQGYSANTVIDASYVHTDNNYTTTEKNKLDGIATGAEVNVNADWNAVSGDAQILNKPTLGTAAATDSTDYATAAQGTLAGTALQPAALNNTALSGIPTAPTATEGTNTEQIATTEFVRTAVDAPFFRSITAVAALDIDCSLSNYFTKTINGNSTFTFSNAPAGVAFAFTLELTHTSGTVAWPASVKWLTDTAPTLTTGKTHLFVFLTDDGGSRWRGAALVDYTN